MKQSLRFASLVILIGLVAQMGCLNVRTPDVRINANAGPPPESINSSQTPKTSSHAEAQAELEKAYRQIRYLEGENGRLREKVEKEKDRGDDYKRKYKRLKDKYED